MKNISDDYIIGISYGFHDSAVALIQNGKVLNAVEEERFTGSNMILVFQLILSIGF